MFDTTTTSITGQPPQFPFQPQLGSGYGFPNNELGSGRCCHPQFLTQCHPFSEGITYTFHPPAAQNGYHTYCICNAVVTLICTYILHHFS